MKHTKLVTIDAEFVELKGNNRAVARGEGGTPRIAINRAMADLFKQPNVRRKRITHFRASITIQSKT